MNSTDDSRGGEVTPGPWGAAWGQSLVSNIFGDGDWEVFPPENSVGPVAICNGEANARLIAAAPEWLELGQDAVPILEVLIDNHQNWQRANGMKPDDDDPALDLLARILALIARATAPKS